MSEQEEGSEFMDPMDAHMHLAAGMPMMMLRLPHPSAEFIEEWKAGGSNLEDITEEIQVGGCFCLDPSKAPEALRRVADRLEEQLQAKNN